MNIGVHRFFWIGVSVFLGYNPNIYAPNIGAPKYIRKILEDFKKDIDCNTIIVGDFNIHCQKWIDHPNKISTKILWH